MIDNFQNSAQISLNFSQDPVLQQILADAPITGARYRGIRVEGVFTPESEITTNAEKYNDYTFACIISVNDLHYAVGKIQSDKDSIILPKIDHSVTHDGKVIFAGVE